MSERRSALSVSVELGSALLALVTALLVWVMASNGELSRISRFPPLASDGLPIDYLNLADGLMIVEDERESVRADLLIPAERASDLRASDLRAIADLAGLGAGMHQVEVKVVPRGAAPPFRLVSNTPNRVLVALEEIVSEEIALSVVITDPESIPQSYQTLTPSASADSITVVGPRSQVEAIERAELRVALQGARAPVSDTLGPILVDADGNVLAESNVEVSPGEIEVMVPIEQRQGYRELVVRPVVNGSPAADYQPAGFTYEPQTVTVVGQPSVVNALNGIVDTESISIEGLAEGEYRRFVPLVLPDSVSPLEEGVITVQITIEPRTGTRSITVTPTVTGVGAGLGVPSGGIVPESVDIFLAGPLIELDALEASDAAVLLDMTGREAGTYLVEPRAIAPGTLVAESVIPQQVEVTLVELEGSREITVGLRAQGLGPDLIAAFDPPTVTAAISGSALPVDVVNPNALTALVSATGLTAGTYELTPRLALAGLSVGEMAPVQVTIAERTALQSVVVPVAAENAPEAELTITPVSLRASYLAPEGAPALTAEQVRATVDLTGIAPGSYMLRPSVVLPPGYLLSSTSPLRIRVILR